MGDNEGCEWQGGPTELMLVLAEVFRECAAEQCDLLRWADDGGRDG